MSRVSPSRQLGSPQVLLDGGHLLRPECPHGNDVRELLDGEVGIHGPVLAQSLHTARFIARGQLGPTTQPGFSAFLPVPVPN